MTSEHGEVPDIFKVNSFEISISGKNWRSATLWRPTERLHATIELLLYPSTEFVSFGETEVIEGIVNPHFVKRVRLDALDMQDSQSVARKSVIRIRAFSRRSEIGLVDINLASLLWSRVYDGILSANGAQCVDFNDEKHALIRLALLSGCHKVVCFNRGETKLERWANDRVQFFVTVDEVIAGNLAERTEIWVSVLGERGQWIRIGTTNAHMQQNTRRKIGQIDFHRKDITTAWNADRTVRLCVAGVRKNVAAPFGFVQFELATLASRQWAEWRVAGCNGVSAAVRVQKQCTSLYTQVKLDVGVRNAMLQQDECYDMENENENIEEENANSDIDAGLWFASKNAETSERKPFWRKRVDAPKYVVKFPGVP